MEQYKYCSSLSAFSRYLNENGIEAAEVKTEYGGEEEETVIEDVNIEQGTRNGEGTN